MSTVQLYDDFHDYLEKKIEGEFHATEFLRDLGRKSPERLLRMHYVLTRETLPGLVFFQEFRDRPEYLSTTLCVAEELEERGLDEPLKYMKERMRKRIEIDLPMAICGISYPPFRTDGTRLPFCVTPDSYDPDKNIRRVIRKLVSDESGNALDNAVRALEEAVGE